MYVYVKLKSSESDQNFISNKIRQVVGDFFSNIPSDLYIPKSDIVKIIKDNIPEIDGVDIYFLSEQNELALIQNKYTKKEKIFNPSTNSQIVKESEVYLYEGEDPGLGMDEHGNIYLENDEQFPVIMGGWSYKSSNDSDDLTFIEDPLIITYY